jgi:hypothetical protein
LIKRKRKRLRGKGKERSHPNWIKGLITSSSKSIIHFGGLWFSPHQHPRSIEIDETYDQNNHDPRPTEVNQSKRYIKYNKIK